MTNASGSKALRKVLFLEIAGFLSLAISIGVVFLVVAMHTTDLSLMAIPFSGLAITAVYLFLTIGYMRKDLHKIHELHAKPIYSIGRFAIYLIGAGLIGYAFYQYFTAKEFWSDISMVVLVDVCLIVGVFAIYYTVTLGYLIQHEHLRHSGISFFDMFLLVLLPIGIVGFSVFTMFSQKAATSVEGLADFELKSDQLIAEFETNKDSAGLKYIGKSVKFPGKVVEVSGDSAILLKLSSSVDGFTTNCGFDRSKYDEVKMIKSGDSISLQCSCSGVTIPDGEMDLLSEKSLDMVRCKLLQTYKSKL